VRQPTLNSYPLSLSALAAFSSCNVWSRTLSGSVALLRPDAVCGRVPARGRGDVEFADARDPGKSRQAATRQRRWRRRAVRRAKSMADRDFASHRSVTIRLEARRHACFAPLFGAAKRPRPSRGHLLFRKMLAWMPTLRRTANRQNPVDFFSRTGPKSGTDIVLVLRQRSFWNSFETVGLVLA
jgi:hypothetical protein